MIQRIRFRARTFISSGEFPPQVGKRVMNIRDGNNLLKTFELPGNQRAVGYSELREEGELPHGQAKETYK